MVLVVSVDDLAFDRLFICERAGATVPIVAPKARGRTFRPGLFRLRRMDLMKNQALSASCGDDWRVEAGMRSCFLSTTVLQAEDNCAQRDTTVFGGYMDRVIVEGDLHLIDVASAVFAKDQGVLKGLTQMIVNHH